MHACWGEKGKYTHEPERERGCWVVHLEAFISLLQVGILGEVSEGGFHQNIHQFSRCVLLGLWSLLVGLCGVFVIAGIILFSYLCQFPYSISCLRTSQVI